MDATLKQNIRRNAQIKRLHLDEVADYINNDITPREIAKLMDTNVSNIYYRIKIIKQDYPNLLEFLN